MSDTPRHIDLILNYFHNSESWVKCDDDFKNYFEKNLDFHSVSEQQIQNLIEILVNDGYLLRNVDVVPMELKISRSGQQHLSNGGYSADIDKQIDVHKKLLKVLVKSMKIPESTPNEESNTEYVVQKEPEELKQVQEEISANEVLDFNASETSYSKKTNKTGATIDYWVLIAFFICLIIVGALIYKNKAKDTAEKISNENVILKFKNGSVFCEGVRKTSGKDKIGTWKFYYPNENIQSIKEYDNEGELINSRNNYFNGNIASIREYDKKGEVVSDKEFSIDSILTFSQFKDDADVIHTTWYYSNGAIDVEKTYSERGEETVTTYETFKSYYPNGQVFQQIEYVDDVPEGKSWVWDENGELMIEYEYENGNIVTSK